ncbi:hypothetical protein [Aeromicrobium sp. UC242_57]|uniref:hypothetical protein n=1 Tax=Aeromicrobium sp. UC242_57 TaxID=3374624 RepID=UPI003793A223
MSRLTRPATWLGTIATSALLASLIPGLVTAPAEAADLGTLVFIKDHDIWLAKGDGTAQRPVTKDGTYADPYRTPSMSDGGTIAASKGTRVVRMTQAGRVLNTMDPPALKNTLGHFVDGVPVDVAISPNGKLIAYTFVGYEAGMARFATGYTAADRLTPASQHKPTYFRSPSWIGSSRTLQTGGFGSQVMIHDLGGEPFHWWDDSDWAAPSTDLSNSELSPNGQWVTVTRDYAENSHIVSAKVHGNAQNGRPILPTAFCLYGYDEALSLDDPTWAPDSKHLAWTEPSKGIYVTDDATSSTCNAAPRLLIRGGSEADWSPAGLSAAPRPALRNTTKPSISGTRKAGKTLTAKTGSWTPKASSYSVPLVPQRQGDLGRDQADVQGQEVRQEPQDHRSGAGQAVRPPDGFRPQQARHDQALSCHAGPHERPGVTCATPKPLIS